MQSRVSRAISVSATVLMALGALGCAERAAAQQLVTNNARLGLSGDLFYNYYVPPGCGGVGAELYPCPRPAPPLVGHTYFTYQPLMPHEFLYQHHRTYFRNNPGAGWTRTTVSWHHVGGPWPWLENGIGCHGFGSGREVLFP